MCCETQGDIRKEHSLRKISTIAIVDDNSDMCNVLSLMIRRLGLKSVVMHDGEEIIDAVEHREVSPDVVVMDYRLPGINGIEASRAISREHPEIKIVIATSEDSVESEAISEGFGFLKKPFGANSFVQAALST